MTAFLLFITPAARRSAIGLNLGCLAIYSGCYIEKGMGLIIPGLTPDTLGEIYEYSPTMTELRVAAAVFAIGFLVFTLMLKVAVPILLGELQDDRVGTAASPVLAQPPQPVGAAITH
jgi:molybdopterin-containing oxidoreductase family membrane subunit